MKEKKRLLVLGAVLREYPRNGVLFEALETQYELVEVHTPERPSGLLVFLRAVLFRTQDVDAIFLSHPSSYFAFAAYAYSLFTRKPIIGDPFISTYDSLVSDRALAKGRSVKGLYYHARDVFSVRACDVLLFDTPEHEAYFLRNCRIPKRTKRLVIPICVDTEKIDAIVPRYPDGVSESPEQKTVLFLGGYIPLQGIQYIIDAATHFRERHDVRFVFIGGGQTKKAMMQKAHELELSNIQFIESLAHEEAMAALKKADVALGIFGDTEKAQRVIPNKVLESMAAGAPVVSGRSVPMERYFKDNKHIFYARLADSKDIARAINHALAGPKIAKEVAMHAQQVIRENFSGSAMREKYVPRLTEATFGTGVTPPQQKAPPKIVIYTAIFGPKDVLRDPMVRPEHCDFICFTDQPLTSTVWQVRRVAPPVSGDPTRSNRHYKFFPNKYLPEYEYSIYLDGNMRLLSDPRSLVEIYLQDANIAFFDHAGIIKEQRSSVYAEADVLIAMHEKGKSKEAPSLIVAQMDAYKKDGFPDAGGLISGMIIVRRHNAPDVVHAMDAWWNELTKWTRRDQLSFNYIAWKEALRLAYIPGDSCNNPFVFRHTHAKSPGLFGHIRTRFSEFLFTIGFC